MTHNFVGTGALAMNDSSTHYVPVRMPADISDGWLLELFCPCQYWYCGEEMDANDLCDFCNGNMQPCRCANVSQSWNWEECENQRCKGARTPLTKIMLARAPPEIRRLRTHEFGSGEEIGRIKLSKGKKRRMRKAKRDAFFRKSVM